MENILGILTSLIINYEAKNMDNMDRDMGRLQVLEQRWSEEDRQRERADRILRVKKYLMDKQSPLADYSSDLVDCAVDNGFHYGFLVGIARAESSLGKYYTLRNNVWNWGVYSHVTFDSIRDGACAVARGIRKNYDTSSTLAIAKKYAPKEDRNDPNNWSQTVEKTIYEISL